ncbi:YqcC family protein [Enterobacteriaceae bacterium ESL0689]|nr:YqcC family protein [Enterobacteriaceae bacterium ESL0689]
MTPDDPLREHLQRLEMMLRQAGLWQETAPDSRALASTQPFCLDTLEPLEWLQWVLLPRMRQLLDSQQPLPQNVAITPYYEMALDSAHPLREPILLALLQLDALLTGDNT